MMSEPGSGFKPLIGQCLKMTWIAPYFQGEALFIDWILFCYDFSLGVWPAGNKVVLIYCSRLMKKVLFCYLFSWERPVQKGNEIIFLGKIV